MFKTIIFAIFFFWLIPSWSMDEQYYLAHPKALQKKLKVCEEAKKNEENCVAFRKIAIRLNKLALELQMNPQEFGNKILNLQQAIANPKVSMIQLQDFQDELRHRLAVVKWLESPG